MIKFGTDGWRAIIADEFTFTNVRACAQGVADYLKGLKNEKITVVIGYDTRFSSEDFAAACAEVLAANDIHVLLCTQPVPTPVLSYAVVNMRSSCGIVITASHNPGNWNGFKVKDSSGASASAEMMTKIENNTNLALNKGTVKRTDLQKAVSEGLVEYYNPIPAYEKHLYKLIDINVLRQANLKIIVDSMYGAGMGYFKSMLGGAELKVEEIHGERNPLFPDLRPEPIARNLLELSNKVKIGDANVGLATDGDADRLGVVAETGEFLNQLEVFSLLALYFIEIRGERNPIIRTLTSSRMLDLIGEKYNLPVFVTKVGFKYVAPLMREKNAFIGGEESGGYGFKGHVPERDGILAGLFFLDYMIRSGKSPIQLREHLFDIVGEHYYDRIDFHILGDEHDKIKQRIEKQLPDEIAGLKVIKLDTMDGYKFHLHDGSWLLIRFSGTEPLVRVYAEALKKEKLREILLEGERILGV